MKFFIHKNKTNFKEYSVRLIGNTLKKWIVNDPKHADFILLSMCDINEIGDIEKAKQYGKPIISGGMVSDFPLVNELSDYSWHGEIYGFRDCVESGINIEDMDSITTKTKKRLIVDQRINWRENPIVRVGKRAMYYYVSKGCPAKCKYCLIGNARDYQKIPKSIYKKALLTCGKNLMPIAAYNPYGIPDNANIGETMLRKYIRGGFGNGVKMIRSGVEFVTKDLSVSMAKGVGIDHVNEAIRRAGKEKTKLILYFIAGFEPQEAFEDFFNKIETDYNTTPAVTMVFTYIDPQPFTPIHDFDLRQKITGINHKKLYHIATQRNKRVRMLPLAQPSKSTLRTILGRAVSMRDYQIIKKVKNKTHDIMIDVCGKHAEHLIGKANIEEIRTRPRRRTIPDYWDSADFISGAT